jgi:DNA helicase-2/ATP-dependent DNA helicase PcrA
VSLSAFNDELARRAEQQHAPTVAGVTLASLHSAKGLEWDAVFLVGLADGTLPTTYAKTPDQLEEERRLLYVGVTRARQWLWLSYGQSRSPGGRARRPCRFLPQLERTPSTERAGTHSRKPDRRRPQVSSCRICGATLLAGADRKLGRCPTCPSDLDEELHERLHRWRATTAAGLKVPAYVVFTDATLVAIAERRPATPADLLAIAGRSSLWSAGRAPRTSGQKTLKTSPLIRLPRPWRQA